jgi:uncharacterized phage protein gp47/JayE
MPNNLDASGLTVASTTEILNNIIAAYQTIYGPGINVGPNSPDGQALNILAQAINDNLQLLVQVYNSFAIDAAFGTVLDQRVAMSGLARVQGTYTLAYVSVTATTALSIPGQDVLTANPNAQVFTVADQAGNQFQLQTSYAFSGAGTQSLAFVCTTLGQIETTPNTITTIITATPGISAVNNPTTASDIEGIPEETDPQLKIRQANSYFLQAVAPADAIRAALLSDVPGCVDAYVVENDTASPVLGVPAYGLEIIVNGGQPAAIAQAIYVKKNPGCALTGSQSFAVVRPQGNTATMRWNNAVSQPLYVAATLFPKIPGQTFDVTADGEALAEALLYKLGQSASMGDIVLAMSVIEPGALLVPTNSGGMVSLDGVTWQNIVSPTAYVNFFVATNLTVVLLNS